MEENKHAWSIFRKPYSKVMTFKCEKCHAIRTYSKMIGSVLDERCDIDPTKSTMVSRRAKSER
jgi:hypothetical protein